MKRSYKKTFVGILAATIVASGFFAAFALDSEASVKPKAARGEGGLEGVVSKEDIFNVVLPAFPQQTVNQNSPTAATYDFILDPKKLLTGELGAEKYPGKTFEQDATLFFENSVNNPTYNYSHISDPLTIQNKGTVNVDVKLNTSITGMNNVTFTGDETFNNDKNASIYLALKDNLGKTSTIDKYGAFLRATLSGKEDAYKIIYDPSTDKYKYSLKSDAELSASNIQFEEYNFHLEGACNTANNWSKLPEPITPKLTVTWAVAPRPNNVGPSIGKTSYTMSKDQANIVDVDLGAGNLAATAIGSITFKNSSNASSALETQNYTFAGDTLTFNASYINGLIDSGITSRKHIVAFNDKNATKTAVTLTINDVAPSIEETSYHITNGQPVLVDIQMGSGDLGASGIKSITFVNKAGDTVALPTNMYAFADGTLEFKAELINNVFKNGVKSRDYTITLNDRDETQMVVTLSVGDDAEFPSIGTTSHTISRNTPLEIQDVDLGVGDLAANGIKSITFKNKAGEIVTLPTDMYTFDGNNVLTFTETLINNFINNGNISRVYTVIFDNPASTQVEITLTAVDAAPFIDEQTPYIMNYDQPVLVNVDLGSGNLGATDIKAITFTNKAGNTITLSTDMYAFADGTLEFKTELINNVLGNGVSSRNYTITLNDKIETQATITLSVNNNNAFPSIGTTSYIIERNTPLEISDVDLGSGNLSATGIESITFINKDGILKTLPTNMYSFDGSVLTFTDTLINNFINNGNITRDYTIIFNNSASTQVKITLTVANTAPSVNQLSYTMVYGQPVVVNINMGSGDLGATDIKSITFVGKSNNLVTPLATDMYTFDKNGTLEFKAEHINKVLSNGITSRDYTITLNDKTASPIIITLEVDNNDSLPSITTTSYTVLRDTPLSMNVDLGSGNLGATGIKLITLINKSGAVATLPTDMYTFNGRELIFTDTHINNLINNGNTSREYTITFNNPTETQVKIILTVDDVSPSIDGANSYIIHPNQPVLVNINRGTGNLLATDIKSVTFVGKSNSTITPLSADMYTFNNGVFEFKAEHINKIFSNSNGITSREYTITLNGKEEKALKVTLKVDDAASFPSIVTTSYTIQRNTPLTVNANLGAGDLKATDINSITFVNKSGVVATLPTNMYTFNGSTLTFAAAHINNFINNGNLYRDYTVSFNNLASTQVKIRLTAANVSPSINGSTSYTMRSGQPVLININLGSGTLGATGIRSITFVNKAGSTATLPSDMYTFNNGTLTLKAAHINNVINNGITSRNYTIILNNNISLPFTLRR